MSLTIPDTSLTIPDADAAIPSFQLKPPPGRKEITAPTIESGITLTTRIISEDTAGVPRPPDFQPHTDLAKRLWEIRQQIVLSGVKLLSLEEIDKELAEQRGR